MCVLCIIYIFFQTKGDGDRDGVTRRSSSGRRVRDRERLRVMAVSYGGEIRAFAGPSNADNKKEIINLIAETGSP